MQQPITSLDGRYAKAVAPLADIMSEFGLMKYRVSVMTGWLVCLTGENICPHRHDVYLLKSMMANFSIDHYHRIKEIEVGAQGTRHDVKAVEYFLREHCNGRLWPWIHICCTSEDVNNVAYALMLQAAREVVLEEIGDIKTMLKSCMQDWAAVPMLSRTHGQPATPTTMGKELAVFHHRIDALELEFGAVDIMAKFNGATGNFAAHQAAFPDRDWPQISYKFIEDQLGLTCNPLTTQIEDHDYQALLLNHISQLSTTMVDLCNDMWLYISNDYFGQKVVAGEVGSSTMPHKVNPIDFENARGNFKIARGLARTLADELPVSTWQRDLSDSTVQRTLGTVFGHFLVALKSLKRGLGRIEIQLHILKRDLDAHPEILTEAIQTVLRKNGHDDAYEQLKVLSRGYKPSLAVIREFIGTLDIPDDDRQRLMALEPHTYVGVSTALVDEASRDC